MRKLFLHLVIASTTFYFSSELTRLVKFASSNSSPASQNEKQPGDVADLIGPDEEKLLKINREYGPAQTRHDRAFFERVERENFILFQRDRNLTKEQDIQEMERWPKDIVYESDVESIRILGNTAVVTGRMHAHHPSGGVITWGFIDVCIRNGPDWQILSTTSVN